MYLLSCVICPQTKSITESLVVHGDLNKIIVVAG